MVGERIFARRYVKCSMRLRLVIKEIAATFSSACIKSLMMKSVRTCNNHARFPDDPSCPNENTSAEHT